jgi:hypothetical protein
MLCEALFTTSSATFKRLSPVERALTSQSSAASAKPAIIRSRLAARQAFLTAFSTLHADPHARRAERSFRRDAIVSQLT